ncbi:hypothetical protein HPB48_001593 [Haemaphysalis longicornis]|uniref:AMP-binding enzyme C-terminal domain-containing protein n=1 Tax=Haemaphysalis longicornis TaxID=44386 RepID=A0A9J6G1N5_HAELO|nr:hypothetical protein HPB48_001593 [Haemaphysalis longicornis]
MLASRTSKLVNANSSEWNDGINGRKQRRELKSRKLRLPTRVRKIVSAGGPIHRALGDRILQQFHLTDFKNFLGCSEALTGFCMPPAGDKAYESVGFPLSHVTMKGHNTGDKECRKRYEVPYLLKYHICSRPQRERDIGYYNQDGRFFVVDRLKNIMKCCDYNVSPQELESILYTHPSVIECCVIGIPDERFLEAPAAFVVRRNSSGNDCSVTEQELVDLVASKKPYFAFTVDIVTSNVTI